MSNQPSQLETNPQLSEILLQLSTLSTRVTHLEEKLQLVSDINKYSKLQELLGLGKFKEADEETTRIILDTLGKHRDEMTPDDMKKFPCTVLQVINNLWITYSQDCFGFSKQLEAYQSVGGNINTLRNQDRVTLIRFADKVGWYENEEVRFNSYDTWDFSLSAPVGCFPAAWWKSPYGLKMVTYCFMRLLECEL